MAQIDYTTGTVSDPDNDLTVTADRIDWAGLVESENTYVVLDFGADFFTGTWTDVFEVSTTTDVSGDILVHFFSNGVGQAGDGPGVGVTLYSADLYPTEYSVTGAANYGTPIPLATGTNYWVRFTRDDVAGDIRVEVFNAATMEAGDLVGDETFTLTNIDSYRYFYPLVTQGEAEAGSNTGYVRNTDLELFAGSDITGTLGGAIEPLGGMLTGQVGEEATGTLGGAIEALGGTLAGQVGTVATQLFDTGWSVEAAFTQTGLQAPAGVFGGAIEALGGNLSGQIHVPGVLGGAIEALGGTLTGQVEGQVAGTLGGAIEPIGGTLTGAPEVEITATFGGAIEPLGGTLTGAGGSLSVPVAAIEFTHAGPAIGTTDRGPAIQRQE